MDILTTLFMMFFKLGFFSFGGGYAMIPLIDGELVERGIELSPEIISNVTAIAGVTPGPVGVNASVAFGYQIGGVVGVIIASLGVALPSLILVVIIASVFTKVYNSKLFKWSLEGLRPIIVGVIFYGAASMAIQNGMFFADAANISNGVYMGNNIFFELKSIILILVSLFLLIKTKIHPIMLITLGAISGVLLF